MTRYGAAAERLRPAIERFSPDALRAWSAALGEETFVGSSGRVFPTSFKATPLLRAWLRRLDALGVTLRARRRFVGFDEQRTLRFASPEGVEEVARRGDRARARRRLLAAARRRRLVGRDSCARPESRSQAAPRQLRLRGRLVARISPALRRPAAEDDRAFAMADEACAAKR